MKIGIIKEGKNPPDERVPLSPSQCKEIIENFPNMEIIVQNSDVRRIQNSEYQNHGINTSDSVADCAILFGIKEVPISQLIPNKTYFYFSHTTKKQVHNRNLLKAMLAKNITMVDYEGLTDSNGKRLIGFGKYAGIVGSYNSLYAYGQRTDKFNLKRAYLCEDRAEMEKELKKIKLPDDFKIIITGGGRVASGTEEILNKVGIKKVAPSDFLQKSYDQPVYTQLLADDYYIKKDRKPFTRKEFYKDPTNYTSNFMPFAKVANMYISCHFWDPASPVLFKKEHTESKDFNIKIIGDISCDINGAVASTIRSSTIKNPLYGFDRKNGRETEFNATDAITVMAVDNLPCELPKDASRDFGREFIDKVVPHLINDKDGVIHRATICKNGDLTPHHEFLRDYIK